MSDEDIDAVRRAIDWIEGKLDEYEGNPPSVSENEGKNVSAGLIALLGRFGVER